MLLKKISLTSPSKRELKNNVKTYSTDTTNGKWVTINGNHVFIEK